ncbi:MAG: aminotransferase class I/II-fold pyridoxal phosphate-dependent enzyme [Phycisphaera sp.]|nr:aminotransferase class I/II-fold pyridoxal phosphate-dependent enzyme [Phycisphaera sp.]
MGAGHINIVDADPCIQSDSGRVGEIWIAGTSVGQGYWRDHDATHHSFNARLFDTHDGPFLRTGDLGFIFEGQLYVTGRQDDLLISHGLNYHPQDVEAVGRKSHPLLNAGFGAAFSVDDDGTQAFVLVHEATHTGDSDFGPVIRAIREAVLEELGLPLHAIVLIRRGMIPKTSSGKVQRRRCRDMYINNRLNALARYQNASGGVTDGYGVTSKRTPPSSQDKHLNVLAAVCQHALVLSGTALSDVTPDTPLAALGLDSLQRMELAAALEKTFACRLPDADFNPAHTLGGLALSVHQHLTSHSPSDASVDQIPPHACNVADFPEYTELKRYERMLYTVAGSNPYFRIDEGGSANGSITRIDGHDLINFCNYDYIGMAHDPRVGDAAKAAIDHYGTGAGASRLVSGEKQVHRDLEHAIAEFLGTQAALVFVSGHATNVSTIGHLFGHEDLIVHDALAHNSIVQGAQLSGATRRTFAHNEFRAMDEMLSQIRHRYRRVLIAIEGVYSMDGDIPDLPHFIELKKKHNALLLVDEAHSLGTVGETGRGIGELCNVDRRDVDLWMGTLSKALASCGGYIAGSNELIEYLAYTTPGFVYSVGIPPSNAAAALAAITLLHSQPQRVAKLHALSSLFLRLAKESHLDTGLPARSSAPVVIVAVYMVAGARLLEGMNVAVLPT